MVIIGKSLRHGEETTQQNPAKGVCLSCFASPGGQVGGGEHRAKTHHEHERRQRFCVPVVTAADVTITGGNCYEWVIQGVGCWGTQCASRLSARTRYCIVAIAVKQFGIHAQHTSVKSFGHEYRTTSQHPAKGAEVTGNQVGR